MRSPTPFAVRLLAVFTLVVLAAVVVSQAEIARAEAASSRAGRVAHGAPSFAVIDTPRIGTAQAQRGGQWFVGKCAECHETTEFANEDFRLNWNGRLALDLYERIRSTMPDDAPGSLPGQAYADIVAYLVTLNGVAAVAEAEPADTAVLRRYVLELRAPDHSVTPPASR